MEDAGSVAGFLICKLGIAFAAIAFIGFALSINTSSTRFFEEQDLGMIVDKIIGAIERIDIFPDGSELRVELFADKRPFEISLRGELEEGLQLLQIIVAAEVSVESSLIMTSVVNGGGFFIHAVNPHELVVCKKGEILLELV